MFPTNKIYTTPKQSLHRRLADCYSGPAELRRMYRMHVLNTPVWWLPSVYHRKHRTV